MRTYLVVIDETPEAAKALRFAARRASRTGGAVTVVTFLPPREFVQWSGVQATLDAEARERAHALVRRAAGTVLDELGVAATVTVSDDEPVGGLQALLGANDVTALVLGAAAEGAPGPLVQHFAGHDTGRLPCPVMVIPGALGDAEIDRLS